MKKETICINCLIKNEERWIWFAIQSVLPYVDKLLIWDTNSTDKTRAVIKSIKSNKIYLKEIGSINPKKFGEVRDKMIKQSKAEWILILDGDEIWPKSMMIKLVNYLKNAPDHIQSCCVRPINFVGDINYIHPEIFLGQTPHGPKGLKGFFSTRIFRCSIPGLHAGDEYGKETFYNQNNQILVEDRKHVVFLKDIYYWHMSYLPRSSSRIKDIEVKGRWRKRKYEIGRPRPKWIVIPEVFYLPRPIFVPDPFYRMNKLEFLRAVIQTPLKKIKRHLTRWKK